MSFSILVATPTAAFGDMIRNSLEEQSRFQVRVVSSLSLAHLEVTTKRYSVAILDGDLDGEGMPSLVAEISSQALAPKLVLIPPENDHTHPSLEGLKCDAFLGKPFYLPDLMELMDRLVANSPDVLSVAPDDLGWVDPSALAAQITASGCRAAVVMKPGGIAVFGGQLPDDARASLLEFAGRFWQRTERSDVVRFVRLNGEEQDALLYMALVLPSPETGLGLVYPVTSPLSKVRSQAAAFVRALRELSDRPPSRPAPIPVVPEAAAALPVDPVSEHEPEAVNEPVPPEGPWVEDLLSAEDLSEEEMLRDFNLAEILGAIPSPDPNGKSESGKPSFSMKGWVQELNLARKDLLEDDEPASGAVQGAEQILTAETSLDVAVAGESLEVDANCVAYPDDSNLTWEQEALEAGKSGLPAESLDPWEETPEDFDALQSQVEPLDLADLSSHRFEPDDVFNLPLPGSLDEDEPFGAVAGTPGEVDFEAFDWKAAIEQATTLHQDAAQPNEVPPSTGQSIPEPLPEDLPEMLPGAPALDIVAHPAEEHAASELVSTAHELIADARVENLAPAHPIQVQDPAGEKPGPILDGLISESALAALTGMSADKDEDEAEGDLSSVLNSLTSLDQLEASSAGISLINYTCVLIPRIPQHYLTRELSERLGQWIQQLCLAFGWRLEGISLRHEYLQWTVQVTPAISPGNVVKIVRQRTSEYLFGQFERLRQENPSGDFWANGYLIVSGSQPPSAHLVRDYISQTRRRQGVGRAAGDNSPRLNS